MNAIVTYLKNVRAELAHVVWPDRTQAIWHSVIIILISVGIALLIAALDYVFTSIVSKLVGA